MTKIPIFWHVTHRLLRNVAKLYILQNQNVFNHQGATFEPEKNWFGAESRDLDPKNGPKTEILVIFGHFVLQNARNFTKIEISKKLSKKWKIRLTFLKTPWTTLP